MPQIDPKRDRKLPRRGGDNGKCSIAKQSNIYLLTQAGYLAAIQLMWACGITSCALRITSEHSFTNLGRMDS